MKLVLNEAMFAGSVDTDFAVPELKREVYRRLEVIAALMRDAASGGEGPRVVWRDEQTVRAVQVDSAVTVGREGTCAVVIDHPRVSRRHCTLSPGVAGFAVVDLGSANGTTVNGARLKPAEPWLLGDGDVIEVAGVRLVFLFGPPVGDI